MAGPQATKSGIWIQGQVPRLQRADEQKVAQEPPTTSVNKDVVDDRPQNSQRGMFDSTVLEPTAPSMDPSSSTASTDTVSVSLPSFLSYVDKHLMRMIHQHNRPVSPTSVCVVCNWQHDLAPITSVYLPLTCGHWLHYRCLVWHACQFTDHNDSCPTCHTKLFEWDAMTVLTVATRTGLEMQDRHWALRANYLDTDTNLVVGSDSDEYVSECVFIEHIISTAFFAQLKLSQDPATAAPLPPIAYSKYTDGSPDVAKMYYEILAQMEQKRRPRCRWLRWTSYTGFLLFQMLVATKLRRWLKQEQGRIVGTEGWEEFEKGWKGLQRRILDEVRQG